MANVKGLMAEKLNPPELDPDDGMECATPEVYPKTSVEDEAERRRTKQGAVQAILTAKAAEAEMLGLAPAETTRLNDLLAKHIDVFREDLGDDPPVKVEPLKETALVRVALPAVGWPSDHLKCFNDVKYALAHVVPRSHPREDMTVCVFTDASDLFWGAVATQVPPADLDLPL
ncbi:hypothetical protein DYB28_009378, partial [Aphanomyces astaci]